MKKAENHWEMLLKHMKIMSAKMENVMKIVAMVMMMRIKLNV